MNGLRDVHIDPSGRVWHVMIFTAAKRPFYVNKKKTLH